MQKSFKKQSGFSLIEVLISMVIIAIGLLGLSGLQIAALKGTTNAHARNVATLLAMELSERMRANPKGVENGFYDNNVGCHSVEVVCENTRHCSPEETARYDVHQVMCGIMRYDHKREGGAANLLPSGKLQVSCAGGGCGVVNAVHDVKISWSESLLHKKDQSSSSATSRGSSSTRSSKTQSITIPVIP